MSGLSERSNAIYQANLDIAQRCTILMLESGQRLCQVQMDSARNVASGVHRLLSGMAAARDPYRVMAAWPQLLQDSVRDAAEASRACVATALDMQSELLRVGHDTMPALNRQIFDGIGEAARAAAGSGGVLGIAAARTEAAAPSSQRARKAA